MSTSRSRRPGTAPPGESSKARAEPRRQRRAEPRGEAPLGEREIQELQSLLDAVPAPLEPLDVSALDGFLCGVLVQPEAVAPSRWLPFVTDIDGRSLPRGFGASRLHALVRRRAAELRSAIERRTWFDPWVFALDEAPGGPAADAFDDDIDADADGDGEDATQRDVEAVMPWVAGCTAALEAFPTLLASDDDALTAPLALLYQHVGTETLEDADALQAEIESLEPPGDLATAVEQLVRATLLLADVAGVATRR
jgi:uncharacterized protein